MRHELDSNGRCIGCGWVRQDEFRYSPTGYQVKAIDSTQCLPLYSEERQREFYVNAEAYRKAEVTR